MKSFKFLIILLLFSLKGYAQQYGNWVRSNCYSFIETRIKFEESYPINNGKFTERNVLVQIKNNSSKRIVLAYHISINKDIKQVYKIVNGNLQTHNINSSYSGSTGVLEIDPHQTITDGMHMINIQDNQTLWIEISCIKEYNNDNKTLKQYYTRCDNGNLCSACQFSSTSSCDDDVNSNHSQNSTGSSGTSSMNRGGNVVTGNSTNTNSEGTGWNGNNGSSNNNYNQQIQNQNTKTTEAFDLYNSTGNYEEAKRKLIEAKNNAPDEASRQVAQQNLDKLDKVEKRNQNVETISKTIDFTTDLIKTMREENKKSIEYATNYELEKSKKERLEKIKFYTNQIDNQQIKISNLEKIEKKFDDYINLIDEYKTMSSFYSYLALYQPYDSKEENKKYKNISEEYLKKSDQIIIEMYEKGFYFPHKKDIFKNDILKYNILDIDNELLSDKIIENLKIDADKGNGKSAYEIAYISSNKINEILRKSRRILKKELSIDDINRYLQKLKYYLDLEFEYLNIAAEKQNKEAILVKNAYKMFGWYKEPRNVMEAQNAFKELIDKKTVEENYFSSVNFKFVENTENKKNYKPISQEFYNKIMDLLIDKVSKFSVTKQLKSQFDDALLNSGITKIPKIEFTKQYESSRIKYEIGDVYFNSNQILIVPKKLEIILLFEKFDNNIIFNDSDLYDTIEENELKFNGWLKNDFSFYIRKEEDVINSYFFKLITNQIKN